MLLDHDQASGLRLKDFEQRLLFVGQNAENLYLILWLPNGCITQELWLNTIPPLLPIHFSDPFLVPDEPRAPLQNFTHEQNRRSLPPIIPTNLTYLQIFLALSTPLSGPPNRDVSAPAALYPHILTRRCPAKPKTMRSRVWADLLHL